MTKLLKSRYEIGTKLGENPFSITYLGRAIEGGGKVVVRIYKRYLLDSAVIQELKRRAEALAKLQHPGIARVLDGDYGWQGFYVVREFVEGESLEERFGRAKAKRAERSEVFEEAVQILTQVAMAIAHAHDKGILHGGLHPSNILIGYDQSVKVADFMIDGMMRSTDAQTALAVVQGAPFVTPEQVRGEDLTPYSDQYLMGSLLYWMTMGHPPFVNGDPKSGIARTLRQIHEKVSGLAPKEKLSPFLNDLFSVALSPDPFSRFPSAHHFLASLTNRVVRRTELRETIFQIRYAGEEARADLELFEIPYEPLKRKLEKKEKLGSGWGLAWVVLLAGLIGYFLVQFIWFH